MLRCTILYNDSNAKMLLTVNKRKFQNKPIRTPMKSNLEVTLGVGDRAILTTCKKKVELCRNELQRKERRVVSVSCTNANTATSINTGELERT